MQNSETDSVDCDGNTSTFVEGVDFYFEDGLMVLTGSYLSNRGYCCEKGCRHCPYDSEETETLE